MKDVLNAIADDQPLPLGVSSFGMDVEPLKFR
jgi:hypothetical protein